MQTRDILNSIPTPLVPENKKQPFSDLPAFLEADIIVSSKGEETEARETPAARSVSLIPLYFLLVLSFLLLAGGISLYIKSTSTLHALSSEPVEYPVLSSSFEEPFVPVPHAFSGQVASIHGHIPSNWLDRSRWDDVDVTYSQSKARAYDGTAALRLDVRRVSTGQVRIAQMLGVMDPNRYYQASVWVRAAEPVTVTFGLRRVNKPYTYYGMTQATTVPEWRQLVVRAKPEDGSAYLMISVDKPVQLDVDDVHVIEAE